MPILPLLTCLLPTLSATTVRQFSHIALALLTIPGRVTMRGLARWSDRGGSYRTIQRFFATVIPWATVFWLFFRHHFYAPTEVYLLAGDEVVVTKAGKHTHGLDRFFSGLLQRPVPGVAFFSLALVSTTTRRAFPLRLEQVIRTPEEKAARHTQAVQQTPAPVKRKPGRPKGSRTQPKTAVSLSPELQRIKTMLLAQLALIGGGLPLTYLTLDGHFGNSAALHMVRECGLHLISKLRADAALYWPYAGPYVGRGPRRKYASKLDPAAIPADYLRHTSVAAGIETRIYQAELLHKEFAEPLNVVILVKTNLKTQAHGHVLLFSSDRALGYEQLIEYYSLRFQIEFTFRDAKQYWGLEDFMNVTATGVTNAANLALFMVNLSTVLLQDLRQTDPEGSVLDLKAAYRGHKYVTETIKLLPQKPDDNLIRRILRQVTNLGRIHTAIPSDNAA
jgi:putative transposase